MRETRAYFSEFIFKVDFFPTREVGEHIFGDEFIIVGTVFFVEFLR
jgi:hypothetical protein